MVFGFKLWANHRLAVEIDDKKRDHILRQVTRLMTALCVFYMALQVLRAYLSILDRQDSKTRFVCSITVTAVCFLCEGLAVVAFVRIFWKWQKLTV